VTSSLAIVYAPLCPIIDCGGVSYRRGWCVMHYMRWRRYGDPEMVKQIRGDDWSRFWSKVLVGDGCWEWTPPKDLDGYGQFSVGTRVGHNQKRAHRLAYEWLVGPIPDGLELDHLCRNRACVNPWDCEPVTSAENLRRGRIARSAA